MSSFIGQTDLSELFGAIKEIGTGNSSNSNKPELFTNSIFGQLNIQSSNPGQDSSKNDLKNFIFNFLATVTQSMINDSNQAVKKNEKEIKSNNDAAKEESDNIKEEVNRIQAEIKGYQKEIKNAIRVIEKLKNDIDISKVREEVEKELEEIEEARKDLSDPDKREDAIKRIKTASANINNLVENINITSDKLTTQQQLVNQSVAKIGDKIKEATEKITTGISNLNNFINKNKDLGTTAQGLNTTGNTESNVGKAMIAKGEGAGILNPEVGRELIQKGTIATSSGEIKTTGGKINLKDATKTAQQIQNSMDKILENNNIFANLGNETTDLATAFNEATQPYIENMKNWNLKDLQDANKELTSKVEELDQTQLSNNQGENKSQTNTKFDFDNKKFKTAFGV